MSRHARRHDWPNAVEWLLIVAMAVVWISFCAWMGSQ